MELKAYPFCGDEFPVIKQAVMLSIRPQWCAMIANGKKTIEVRKNYPRLDRPFKCYIYCITDKNNVLYKDWIDPPFVTQEYNIMRNNNGKNVFGDKHPWGNANGKVIGEFICDKMYYIAYSMCPHDPLVFEEIGTTNRSNVEYETCLTETEFGDYLKGNNGYGWHISDLKIYDKPKPIGEFKLYNRSCKYSDLGFAIPKCETCTACNLKRAPSSWCYIDIGGENG